MLSKSQLQNLAQVSDVYLDRQVGRRRFPEHFGGRSFSAGQALAIAAAREIERLVPINASDERALCADVERRAPEMLANPEGWVYVATRGVEYGSGRRELSRRVGDVLIERPDGAVSIAVVSLGHIIERVNQMLPHGADMNAERGAAAGKAA